MFSGVLRRVTDSSPMARWVLLVFLAWPALQCTPALAQEAGFRLALEMVVFLQLDPASSTENIQVTPPALPAPQTYPAPLELPDSGSVTPPPPDGVLALTRAQYALDGAWLAMRRSAEYRPLAHFSWTMPRDWSGKAIPVRLSTLSETELPFSGLASLEEERFVHFTLDLRMPAGPGDEEVFRLNERRRLLLGEVHYFDHPRFGAIVRMFRYRPRPEEKDGT